MSGLLDGVLPWIFSQGDTMKRNLRGNVKSLLEDPRGYAQSVGQDIATENTRRSQAAKALLYPSVMDEQGQQQAMQAMTETALNLLAPTVYHGSPHKFDRFDSSKIGTGEGAQAYGHGLYVAESPNVAATYRNALSDTLEVKGAAQPIEKRAAQMALTFGDNTTEGALQWLSKFEGKGANHVSPAMTPELVAAVKAKFLDGTFSRGGNLYKVDLPDDMAAKMLDWDKPLSQQPEAVRKALEDAPGWPFIKQFIERDFTRNVPTGVEPTGQALHEVLSGRMGGQNKSSDYFQGLGIPGIRYLDAGSRGAGKGSYNYVVFPGGESQLKILERNGKGLLDR